jgi:ubiquinone/menaquinone biosynthesis C-methylase UbiE
VIDPARSFDRAAEDYERTRPGYPDAILEALPLRADAEVLDVGAGTGKLTRVLVRRYRSVVAVEPLDGMRAILERGLPEVEVHTAGAEALPFADASFDGVFAGQAFHWFATDEAVAEFARLLRPGGIVALVWNEPRDPSPLPQAFHDRLEELRAPVQERIEESESWVDLLRRGPFGEVHEAYADHENHQDRASVLASTRTFSWVAFRPEDEREQIARELDSLLDDGPFAFKLRANVFWAVRR